MSTAGGKAVRGRLANVTAVVFAAGEASEPLGPEASERLGLLFEEVSFVGSNADTGAGARGSVLGRLAKVFEAAGEERVLVWDPALAVPSAVLLALCAWPEHPAVSVRIDGDLQALCAIYQREPALACALELIDAGETGPSGLLAELDASVIEGDDLAPLLE